jgi:hypothetical protein
VTRGAGRPAASRLKPEVLMSSITGPACPTMAAIGYVYPTSPSDRFGDKYRSKSRCDRPFTDFGTVMYFWWFCAGKILPFVCAQYSSAQIQQILVADAVSA